jgi:hypothetical protein
MSFVDGLIAASPKVVFLDIDGVICTRKGAGWTIDGRPLFRSLIHRPIRAIDPAAMQHLNDLCTRTGAEVVVSSMWLIDRDVRTIFAQRGFTGQFHHDWRTDADGPMRSHEIRRWLADHGNPNHVVIDDQLQQLLEIAHQVVLTNNYCGLTAADVTRAVQLLEG